MAVTPAWRASARRQAGLRGLDDGQLNLFGPGAAPEMKNPGRGRGLGAFAFPGQRDPQSSGSLAESTPPSVVMSSSTLPSV